MWAEFAVAAQPACVNSEVAQAEVLSAVQHTMFWDSAGKTMKHRHVDIEQALGPLALQAMKASCACSRCQAFD